MTRSRGKVVCAMSGGVDSSVAAALLLRAGYDVVGVFMRLGTPPGVVDACATGAQKTSRQGCCSVLDADDARRVAGVLGIPLYVLNFQEDFGRVIDYFAAEYGRGRTPNPCVRCNDWLKFGRLAQYARAVGAEFVASGHYARVGTDEATGERELLRGLDHRKDQSYVLFGVSRQMLDHLILPIGELEKPAVREMAEQWGLPTFNKPDSQEICFVPDQDYAGMLRRRDPASFRAGSFVGSNGEILGTHPGHQHFTIGQRKGLGIALGAPAYVVEIDAASNRVRLGSKDELCRRGLVASQVNVLSARIRPGEAITCMARIRYNSPPQPAHALWNGSDELRVRFCEPQPAITPGQAVVCYDGETVVCGGWIDAALD
jgi:tRNA-specific 2-thiouridylase